MPTTQRASAPQKQEPATAELYKPPQLENQAKRKKRFLPLQNRHIKSSKGSKNGQRTQRRTDDSCGSPSIGRKPDLTFSLSAIPRFGIAHALCLGLAPWLAADIPILVDSGMIKHKDDAAPSAES
ncbi:hypothetical protein YC2023_109591 [Brassica napus]